MFVQEDRVSRCTGAWDDTSSTQMILNGVSRLYSADASSSRMV